MPQLWPGCSFPSSNLLPQPLNETGNYTKPVAAGDACVLDPLDTMHHEVNSILVHSHHVYKSVRSLVVEQPVLEKEPDGQSTQWICSGSKFIVNQADDEAR